MPDNYLEPGRNAIAKFSFFFFFLKDFEWLKIEDFLFYPPFFSWFKVFVCIVGLSELVIYQFHKYQI